MNNLIKDEFGPEYVVRVYDPKLGMEGFLVIDSTLAGPSKGGFRMTPDVTALEVFRLARAMTYKNILADIPFGGAKAGIVWNGDRNDLALKEKYIRSFANKIKPFLGKEYISAPDVNVGKREVDWLVDEVGNWNAATGKSKDNCTWQGLVRKCGIPHELGSTGYGVAQSTLVATEVLGMDLTNSTVAIHGFGNVGVFAYKFLKEMGANIVGLANSKVAIYSEQGIDDVEIQKILKENGRLEDYPKEAHILMEDFWGLGIDILIPASVTDVINESNKDDIKAKLIVEGANIPMQEDIENALYNKGVVIVPDIIANSGGVISSYAEYKGYKENKMFELIRDKVYKITKEVLSRASEGKRSTRLVALDIAKERLKELRDNNL